MLSGKRRNAVAMPRRWLFLVALLAGLSGIGLPAQALRVWESGTGDRFIGAEMNNVAVVKDSDGTEALRLADNEAPFDGAVDLLLRGNSRADFDVANYSIRSEDVIIDTVLPLFGSGSMRFVRPENRVVIVPKPGSLLSEERDLGSFSIDFWISPYSTADGEEIFSRYGTVGDDEGRYIESGLRIVFRDGKVVSEFRNFFRDGEGAYHDLVVEGEHLTRTRQWQHIAFSYDARSGKLSRLVNGIEDAVLWATDSGRYQGSPLRAAFPKGFRRHAVLGGGFRGRLEDFRIRREAWHNATLGRYSTSAGRITSRVVDMGTEQARLVSASWQEEAPGGAAILFEYRTSDTIFAADHAEPAWSRLKNGTRNFSVPRGRYLQWRATLVGSERGRFTPLLKSVRLVWDPAFTPATPDRISVTAGNGRVVLHWRGVLDKIAGYRIYIGTERGEYLHPDSPIDVPLDRIDQRRPEYRLYGLENDRLYYIAIVAYTEDGMQSAFSREIRVRPSELD